MRSVQELLGHSKIATTQRYTHLDMDALTRIYDKAHPLAEQAAKHMPMHIDDEQTEKKEKG